MTSIAATGGLPTAIRASPNCSAKSRFPIRRLPRRQLPTKKRARSFAKRSRPYFLSQPPDTRLRARALERLPAPLAGARSGRIGKPDIRHSTSHRSAAPGISTFGARYADKSRVIPPRHRQAPPISIMPSSPRKLSWQPPTSICSRPIPCTICFFAPSRSIKKTLDIVQNQFKAGYSVTAGDVSTAQAQLFNAQAQLFDADVQRAQYEHAIAMLIGRPPAELSIARRLLGGSIPKNPDRNPFDFAGTASRHCRG